MRGVVQDWPAVNDNKIRSIIDNIMDHINGRLASLETNPELAALRLVTTPSEWPVAAIDLATYGEPEVRFISKCTK